ncbi:uncharacterized protein LOC124917304 [Impatiens glandulifera]|uniref:uncharacterized protein LOC124917304 n=1 Tax=Impatiens glandulifera TaxID=253017 RepID=UPI001FB16589|nr:uncharacterized protein LOC124917304 [Impatiens glandulifera]
MRELMKCPNTNNYTIRSNSSWKVNEVWKKNTEQKVETQEKIVYLSWSLRMSCYSNERTLDWKKGDDVIDCVNMNNQLASNHGPIVDNTKDLKADNYNTGCYDHDCAGFVQIDFSIQLGQPIFPSTLGGQLTFLTVMVYKDGVNGHWWLDVNGILRGYFPKYIFTSLSEYAERVDFGGEILNKENEGHHTTTQMGNGLYPSETRASVISLTRIYDQYRNPVEEMHEVLITAAQCYGAYIFSNAISYGGPGYSAICP